MSQRWQQADAADRMQRRLEISRRVALARKMQDAAKGDEAAAAAPPPPPKRDGERGEKKASGFDYARALSGIAGESSADSTVKSAAPMVASAAAGATLGAMRGNAQQNRDIGPGSGRNGKIPRSKAARKRARKKAKKAAARKQAAAKAAAAKSPPPSGNGSTPPSNGGASDKKPGGDDSPEVVSSEAVAAEAASSESSATTGDREQTPSGSGAAGGRACAACGRPLVGTYTEALGRRWHGECFRCGLCQRSLSGTQFRERRGTPCCEACYLARVAPRCAQCEQPIAEQAVVALGQNWHKNCLVCILCHRPLTQTFYIYHNKPREPRCSRCHLGTDNPDRWPFVGHNAHKSQPQAPTLGDLPTQGPALDPTKTVGRARLFGAP